MSDLPSPQAEAAYRRALSAYQKESYDEAERWATEALAIQPAHAPAAALLRRIGGREAGPRVVSMDPSILVSGNSGFGMAEPADPTIVVPRRAPRAASPKRKPAPPSPAHGSARRASEPTVIVPSNAGSHGLGNASFDRPASSLWQRLWGGGGRRERFPVGGATPRARGLLIVAGATALAAIAVWGGIRAFQLLFSDGPSLTIEAPEGGKIMGDGIRCGAGSSRCSTSFSKGDRVELTPEAERDYEFVGFTGDCEATRGVLLMDGPKTCGATFERRPVVPPSASYTLTIEKPKGGTVIFELTAITCGTLGSECSEEIPAGKLVTLRYEADQGYKFDSFSGECNGGEFVMNSARTCGAVFIASPGVNAPPPKRDADPGAEPRPSARNKPETKPTGAAQAPPPAAPPAAPLNPPVPSTDPPVAVAAPQPQGQGQVKPPPPPDTAEEHAKKEIKQRLDAYCSALETLKPEEVLKVFPRQDARILKRQFQGYKSLKCAWTSEFKYHRFDISAINGSASAQVEVGMKQTPQMHGGGAPKAQETTVTFDLSRFDQFSPWKIDDMRAVEKK